MTNESSWPRCGAQREAVRTSPRAGRFVLPFRGMVGGQGSDNRRTKDGDHSGAPVLGKGRGSGSQVGFFSGACGIFAFSLDFGNSKKVNFSTRVSIRASQPALDGNAATVSDVRASSNRGMVSFSLQANILEAERLGEMFCGTLGTSIVNNCDPKSLQCLENF